LSGPTSFVAAEIHLGRRPAAIHGDRPHCNIQVACHTGIREIFQYVPRQSSNYEDSFTATAEAERTILRQ
jgi:hypothetical protein